MRHSLTCILRYLSDQVGRLPAQLESRYLQRGVSQSVGLPASPNDRDRSHDGDIEGHSRSCMGSRSWM